MSQPSDSPSPDSPLSGQELSRLDRARELLAERRALAAILGAVVVVAAAWFLLLPHLTGGGGESASAYVPPAHPAAAASTSAPAAAAPVVTANNVLKIRDPFTPLYTPPTVAPLPAPSPTPTPTPSPSTVVVVVPSSSPTPAQSLKLIRINADKSVDVTVNGTAYHVLVGKDFATNFQLFADTATSATFFYGDSQFTLAPGQAHTFG